MNNFSKMTNAKINISTDDSKKDNKGKENEEIV